MSNPQKKIKLDPERSVPLKAALFPDILLYCAKPQEFEYVREYFVTEQDAVQIQGFVSTPRSGTSSILGTFGDGDSRQSFVLCHGAIQGPEVAAATLAICLCDFQPSYFAMLGMCAGKPKLAQFCVVCGYGASNVDERKDKPAHTEKVNRGSYEVLAATICESLEANPPKDADGNPLPVTLESGTMMSGASVDETGKVFEKSVRRTDKAYEMEASAAFTAYKMFNASAAGRSCKLLGVFKGIADFGDQASRAAKPSATASNERATASEEGVQGGTPAPAAAAAAPAPAVISKEQCQRKATQNAALVFLRGVVPYLQRKLPGDYAPEASSYVRAVERKELLGAVENHHKAALKAKAGGQPASFNSAHVSYPWVNVSSVDHTDTDMCVQNVQADDERVRLNQLVGKSRLELAFIAAELEDQFAAAKAAANVPRLQLRRAKRRQSL